MDQPIEVRNTLAEMDEGVSEFAIKRLDLLHRYVGGRSFYDCPAASWILLRMVAEKVMP